MRYFAEPIEKRRVALDEVGKKAVSTVRLPFDHGFDDVPMLYETMVSDEAGEWDDDCQWRYTTREEAEDGHRAVVAWLKGEAPRP